LFIINTLVRCHFGKAVPKAVHGDSLARSGFLPLQSLAAVRSKVSYADKAVIDPVGRNNCFARISAAAQTSKDADMQETEDDTICAQSIA
jgi:hypothetical protein